ncbi:MAG: ParB N-terminal domain-containing protein [Lachnospiraceae bacterium]|nr:ParB N-terminal domain-containing protein [Lachnospiraceae bacterium]
MAKNFKKRNSAFAAAKAAESIMAKQDEIKVLPIDKIDAYADNNEDISNIDDLLASMKENGFTDPIEVTNYGCEDGRYVVLSGHRRLHAWNTLHNGSQPVKCIVVDSAKFKSDADVKNYVLMANSQRDSAKDPLLLIKRYKEHEKYLNEIKFDGNIRDEIANRLGISTQQADRYKQLGKCIPEIQQMVAEEKIGMSTAVYIAPLETADQEKFYQIMLEAIADETSITRTFMQKMIKHFKAGHNDWSAIKEEMYREDHPDMPLVSADPTEESSDKNSGTVDDETDEYDTDEASEEYQADEDISEEDTDDEEEYSKEPEESSERKNANDLIRALKKLDLLLNNKIYDFEDEEAVVNMARETVNSIKENIIDPFDAK